MVFCFQDFHYLKYLNLNPVTVWPPLYDALCLTSTISPLWRCDAGFVIYGGQKDTTRIRSYITFNAQVLNNWALYLSIAHSIYHRPWRMYKQMGITRVCKAWNLEGWGSISYVNSNECKIGIVLLLRNIERQFHLKNLESIIHIWNLTLSFLYSILFLCCDLLVNFLLLYLEL